VWRTEQPGSNLEAPPACERAQTRSAAAHQSNFTLAHRHRAQCCKAHTSCRATTSSSSASVSTLSASCSSSTGTCSGSAFLLPGCPGVLPAGVWAPVRALRCLLGVTAGVLSTSIASPVSAPGPAACFGPALAGVLAAAAGVPCPLCWPAMLLLRASSSCHQASSAGMSSAPVGMPRNCRSALLTTAARPVPASRAVISAAGCPYMCSRWCGWERGRYNPKRLSGGLIIHCETCDCVCCELVTRVPSWSCCVCVLLQHTESSCCMTWHLIPGTHLLLESAQQVCIGLCCVGAGCQGQGYRSQQSGSPRHAGLRHLQLQLRAAGLGWHLPLLLLPLLQWLPSILRHPLL
jgi:hypothetical protein